MAKKLPPDVLEFFRQEGAKGGKIGGKKSLETMTPAERQARARKAAAKSAEVRAQNAQAKRPAGRRAGCLHNTGPDESWMVSLEQRPFQAVRRPRGK